MTDLADLPEEGAAVRLCQGELLIHYSLKQFATGQVLSHQYHLLQVRQYFRYFSTPGTWVLQVLQYLRHSRYSVTRITSCRYTCT